MIDFVNNSEPDLTAENLNKLQQDIGTVVSPTEPQGNERLKVWIKKGKNLISIERLLNVAINESTGGVDYNTTRLCSDYIYLLKGVYSISCNLARFAYAIYDEKKQFNKFISWNSFPNQFAIEKNCYVRIEFVKNADGSVGITKDDISTLQLEQNSEVTEYEAYIEPKTYVLNNNNVYEEFKKEVETDWINLISGYNTFYRKINRIVEINLNIYDSAGFSVEETVNKLLGTLPEGFRPSKDINIPVFSRTIGGVFTNPLRLIVKTTGEVNIYNWGTTLKFEVIQAYLTYNV